MALPQETPKEVEIFSRRSAGQPGLTTRRSKNNKSTGDDSEPPLEQLPASQDWVHWLYLQPPRGAEVLVQACGRTFITTWNQQSQQWGTRELPQDHDGLSLPHLLPKIVEVTPSCLLLPPPSPSRTSIEHIDGPAGDAAAVSGAGMCEQVVHLSGPNLRAPGVRITARFHGRILQTKLLTPSSPSAPLLQQQIHYHLAPYQGWKHPQQHPQNLQYQGYYQNQQGMPGEDPNDVPLAILGVDQPGMLLLECWHGQLLTGRKQVVVLDDPQVVGELNNQEPPANEQDLLAEAEGSTPAALELAAGHVESSDRMTDDLLMDLGCWVEFMMGIQRTQPPGVPLVLEGMDGALMGDALLALRPSLSASFNGPSSMNSLGHSSTSSMAMAAEKGGSGLRHASSASGQEQGSGGHGHKQQQQQQQQREQQQGGRSVRSGGAGGGEGGSSNSGSGGGGGSAHSGQQQMQQPQLGGPWRKAARLSPQLLHACRQRAYQTQIMEVGIQLLEHSCSCAWQATATMLLEDLMSLGYTYSQVKKAASGNGMTLLHRAVCSGSQQMVACVVGWGTKFDCPWDWSEADPVSGITPLHVAAIVPSEGTTSGNARSSMLQASISANTLIVGSATDLVKAAPPPPKPGGKLADWILQEYEAAWQYWHGAADVTGSTPADIAEAYAFTSCGDIGSIHSSAVGQGSEGFLKAAAFGSEFVNILQQSSTSNVVATDEFGSGRKNSDGLKGYGMGADGGNLSKRAFVEAVMANVVSAPKHSPGKQPGLADDYQQSIVQLRREDMLAVGSPDSIPGAARGPGAAGGPDSEGRRADSGDKMGLGPSVARLLLQRAYNLSVSSMHSVLPHWTSGLTNQVRKTGETEQKEGMENAGANGNGTVGVAVNGGRGLPAAAQPGMTSEAGAQHPGNKQQQQQQQQQRHRQQQLQQRQSLEQQQQEQWQELQRHLQQQSHAAVQQQQQQQQRRRQHGPVKPTGSEANSVPTMGPSSNITHSNGPASISATPQAPAAAAARAARGAEGLGPGAGTPKREQRPTHQTSSARPRSKRPAHPDKFLLRLPRAWGSPGALLRATLLLFPDSQVEVRYVCWVTATRRALYNVLPCLAVALAACAGMRQALLHIGGSLDKAVTSVGGSLHAATSAALMDAKARGALTEEGAVWGQDGLLYARDSGISATDVLDDTGNVGREAWVGVGAVPAAGFVRGGDGVHESVMGAVAPYVLVLLAMAPWALALLLVRVLPASQAHALVWSEPTGVAFMIWFAAVRALMAAGMLHAASTRFWLAPGSSMLMALEDMMQILLPVRTPQAALPCCLNALSTAALYIQMGSFSGPGAAFFYAMLWGCVCLLGFFVMDLWSRRAYFRACRTQVAVSTASAQHAKR